MNRGISWIPLFVGIQPFIATHKCSQRKQLQQTQPPVTFTDTGSSMAKWPHVLIEPTTYGNAVMYTNVTSTRTLRDEHARKLLVECCALLGECGRVNELLEEHAYGMQRFSYQSVSKRCTCVSQYNRESAHMQDIQHSCDANTW